MGLIFCAECQNKVSNTVSTCPKCGAPISIVEEVTSANDALTTIQGTHKKLKLQSVISTVLFIIGLFGSIIVSQSLKPGESSIFFLILAVGIIWHVTTKIRIWWNHN